MKTVFVLFFLLTISLQARSWTSVDGRKIEAEMVRPDGDQVVVSMGGKEINIPRSKLSKEDLDFVDGWKPPELTLAGVVIVKGGKANVIERDYSPEALKAIKTDKSGFTGDFAPESKKGPIEGETKLKLAVAVPADFDPLKAPNVMIATAAVNNANDQVTGNFRAMNSFAKHCADQGWVCLTVDSNTGMPSSFTSYAEAIGLLEKEWRGMAKARYCTGGHSGGSKGCWGPVAWLVKAKKPVVGVFMAGCNQLFAADYRKQLSAPAAPYHDIKAFLSNGTTDKIAPVSKADNVVAYLKTLGVHNIRREEYDGGHMMHSEHIDDALKWFAETK